MSEYIATVVDTTGIQPYIFGSNRLRENVGASYLVDQATNAWIEWALHQLGENIYIPEPNAPIAEQHIEDGEIAAELIYSGGGNAVLLFKNMGCAKRFTNILSEKVLREAPGLKIVVAHSQFEWGYKLSEIVDELMKELERKKREYSPSAPLLGLGVTALCASTGLAAVNTSDRYNVPTRYPISREIVEKLKVVDKTRGEPANNHLISTIFGEASLKDYQIPYDVDDLGRSKDENSYIAVVHADGNNISNLFKECGKGELDRKYIRKVRDLSKIVREAGENALKVVAKTVIRSIEPDGKVMGLFSITERDGRKYLPFRPLVYGGDDVTFVCDGRLGLTLAALYLQSFKEEGVKSGKNLTACAGVAIVKTHYPFARAYKLSEALCSSAKNFVRDEKERLRTSDDFSALDWHIAASGLLGSLSEIRNREYRVPEGNLTMRPVYLQSDSEWRNWANFAKVVHDFNTHSNWAGRRNKVIALREVLRAGSDKTKQFLQVYGLDENYLPSFITAKDKDFNKCGWTDAPTNERVCGYFDAIEAIEFYIS